jgi:predicted Zn-dependent protease
MAGVITGRSWNYHRCRALAAGVLALTITVDIACRRKPSIPDATYRQAVTAFYVSLAAMQTSQDVLARTELERLIQLVPDEAAGWANLGLLLLRQQQFDEAAGRLAKAASLAPRNAAIERLRGLNESRNGHLDRSATGVARSSWIRQMSKRRLRWPRISSASAARTTTQKRSASSMPLRRDRGTWPPSSNSPVSPRGAVTAPVCRERSTRWRSAPRPGRLPPRNASPT